MKKFGKCLLAIAFLLFVILTILGKIQTRKDTLAVELAIEKRIQEILATPKSSQKKVTSRLGFSKETNEALNRVEERLRRKGINPNTLSNQDREEWQIAIEEIEKEIRKSR